MHLMDIILKVLGDLFVVYGGAMATVAILIFLKWFQAHTKNERLKVIARGAFNAVAAQDNILTKPSDQKKEDALKDLSATINSNLWRAKSTPKELDMHIEAALQYLRAMQTNGTDTQVVADANEVLAQKAVADAMEVFNAKKESEKK